jgi:hypothetical protein
VRPTAHFSFWTPWRGGCAGTAGASARYTRGSPNPTKLPPWPEPKTGRSAGTDTDPARSLHPPFPGPPLPSAVAYSDRPSALATPAAATPPPEPPFPTGTGPPPARETSAPASTRGDNIPLEGWLPPQPDGNDSMQDPVPPGPPHTAAASRRTPCAAATPKGASEFAKRLIGVGMAG